MPIYAERYPLGLPPKSVSVDEVQQPESQLQHEISIPATPSILNTESKNELYFR